MKLGTLQLIEVAAFVLIAGSAHVLVAVAGRPFWARLEKIGGQGLRALNAVSHVLSGVLYVAYAAAVLPIETVHRVGRGVGPYVGPYVGSYKEVGPYQIEAVMNSIAFFALFVVLVQLLSLRLVYGVAHHLEDWPPRGAPASV